MMTETLTVYTYWEASLNWTCNGRLIPWRYRRSTLENHAHWSESIGLGIKSISVTGYCAERLRVKSSGWPSLYLRREFRAPSLPA